MDFLRCFIGRHNWRYLTHSTHRLCTRCGVREQAEISTTWSRV